MCLIWLPWPWLQRRHRPPQLATWYHVAVGVERDRYGRMAEPLLHYLRMRSFPQQQACMEVAQVVSVTSLSPTCLAEGPSSARTVAPRPRPQEIAWRTPLEAEVSRTGSTTTGEPGHQPLPHGRCVRVHQSFTGLFTFIVYIPDQ